MGQDSGERGIVLIVVLWTVLVVALISFQIVNRASQDLRLARNLAERTKVELAADGAIRYAIAELAGPSDLSLDPAQPSKLTVGEVLVELSVEPEAGRLDLNEASSELIEALLLSLGIPDGEASRATELIATYRSETAPSGGRFGIPSDLAHVQGLPPEIRRAMLPYVTTFTGLSRPIGMTTLSPVRQALVASKQDAPVPSDTPSLWLGQAGPSPGLQPAGPARLVRISAVATGPEARFARTAVVSIGSSGDQRYRILCWQCALPDP